MRSYLISKASYGLIAWIFVVDLVTCVQFGTRASIMGRSFRIEELRSLNANGWVPTKGLEMNSTGNYKRRQYSILGCHRNKSSTSLLIHLSLAV